jgi:diguanylate cyclase (GGDEF)-like protein/PAS domain S-box-containing protein
MTLRAPRFVSAVLAQARLSDDAFQARHRALRMFLWLQIPILALVALIYRDHDAGAMADMGHMGGGTWLVWVMAAAMLGCATLGEVVRSRRVGAASVSMGLLLAAALLVSIGGGRTDLHFGYFLVLALISLYQDWLPLVVSVVLVVVEHLLMGEMAPDLIYSDHTARNSPIAFAVLHAGFVAGVCAVQVVYWSFIQKAQDETDRVRAESENALRATADRFEALVQDSTDVILVLDGAHRITSASAAVTRIMGYAPADLLGTGYHDLIDPDDVGKLTGDRAAEVRVRHADGAWHWHEVIPRDLSDNPAVGGVVLNHRDVTERRAFQERLVYEASHDALTSLANRAELLRAVGAALDGPDRPGVAVLFLDLDGFKQVNDTYGHEAGDALLVSVSASLQRSVLGSDLVGRIGGDEFAIVLHQVKCADDAITVAKRILSELSRPVEVNGVVLQPRTSIGIALADGTDAKTDELLGRADSAMYHAKRDTTISWQLYLDGMHDEHGGTVTLEDDLKVAVERGQLRLDFQPVVTLDNGELVGFEALVRWQHPRLGLLQPDDFIPLATQSDLITEIGAWVLPRACRQVRVWQQRVSHGPRLSLSVNMARRELESPTLVADVLGVLEATGFAPADLILEVTEADCVDAEPLVTQMAALHEYGIRFALDDFGTGLSSLKHLTRLPVDVLKLDTCFVATLDGTSQGSAVAEAVIRLGHSLHLDTVAEGVETRAQADELTLLGCRTGQGFLFAHPLPPHEVDALLDSMLFGDRPKLGVPTPVRHEV